MADRICLSSSCGKRLELSGASARRALLALASSSVFETGARVQFGWCGRVLIAARASFPIRDRPFLAAKGRWTMTPIKRREQAKIVYFLGEKLAAPPEHGRRSTSFHSPFSPCDSM
jgi:hypothetical protein